MKKLSQSGCLEEIIKRSRFIAQVAPVQDQAAAEAWMSEIRDPDATHNCWAWKIGERHRYSDDGEPGGTAGRPIFTAIDRSELDHVAVVVTRFFGGIKLGAGGLVRAYGGAAARCLKETPQYTVVPHSRLAIEVPFSDTGTLYNIIDHSEAQRLEEAYGQSGLRVVVRLPTSEVDHLADSLREATAARGNLEVLEETEDS